jgi:hypothetical protein
LRRTSAAPSSRTKNWRPGRLGDQLLARGDVDLVRDLRDLLELRFESPRTAARA